MLELKNITKVYPAAGEDVEALKGISLCFEDSGFVSILGPSGCGKTTLLNIIGGLDHYTSGDLVINGISTTKYKDRDWDAYRNHSIGFVFQSYNLIPHQTVLQNVELALTLAGVSKKERRERAKQALTIVGLEDQIRKRPAEMSGGQMQRVAIARAIVNHPDIILADEPTGALDTETSVQVMDILEELSKDHLVIMVTHNPDLANRYSTRIIRMLDGRILNDEVQDKELEEAVSESVVPEEEMAPTDKRSDGKNRRESRKRTRKEKMPSMSLFTAFGLSLKNLFSKKGRTILTSFAGSIGIIGIALIYAVSQGTTDYINFVQESTLSSYPITIESEELDMGSMIETFMGKAASIEEHDNDAVYQKAMTYELMNSLNTMETTENDLESFRTYIQNAQADEENPLHDALTAVQYAYDINVNTYTKNPDGEIRICDMQQLMIDIMKEYADVDMSSMLELRSQTVFGDLSSMMTPNSSLWNEILPGLNGESVNDVIKKQYDVIYGRWPEEYNEVILYVDEKNEVNDLALYAMGLISDDEIDKMMDATLNGKEMEYDVDRWSYEEICNKDFRVILDCDRYVFDAQTGTYTDLTDTDTGLKFLYDDAMNLKVVGIVRPNEDAIVSGVSGGIGYTYKLTEDIIEKAKKSEVVKAQLDSRDVDVLTGLNFKPEEELSDKEKSEVFEDAIQAMKESKKAETYVKIAGIPSDEMIEQSVNQTFEMYPDRASMEQSIVSTYAAEMGMDEQTVKDYLAGMSDDELNDMVRQSIEKQVTEQYEAQVAEQMAQFSETELSAMMDDALETYTEKQKAAYYDDILEFSASSYEDNLISLGLVDIASPSAMSLYAVSFADKDVIEDAIRIYNDGVDDLEEISYTDYVGLIMSSITSIINAITYVLIAFVAVSLIVSSIMIGVITLISVQERTKEIGILRSLGASKKNVSSLFNVETVMIGFASGLIGVGVTYLLTIPVNLILHKLTGIGNLSASLPFTVAVALILISMLLTMFAGIIPSRSASKMDPVVALRTE